MRPGVEKESRGTAMAQAKTKTDRRTKPELLAALAAEEARTDALRTRLADAEGRAGAAERMLQEEKNRAAGLEALLERASDRNDLLHGQLHEARRFGKKFLKKLMESLNGR